MTDQPRLITSCQEMLETLRADPIQKKRIGLVPTMGALHAGHLSLVQAARDCCDVVVVTIFVNPTQFAPGEDLDQYPRQLEKDLQHLATLGVQIVFAPREHEIYPDGFSTTVNPPTLAKPWEGVHRPHHFAGVLTVVSKLFHLVPADVAFFGQKDYQQAMVIQQMVRDLNFPIEIRVCPVVRDEDGLAMSSRNQYLDSQQRPRATALSRCLVWAQACINQGEQSSEILREGIANQLTEAGFAPIDYIAIVHPETLAEVEYIDGPAMLLLAAHLGQVRLIDNCQLLPA